MQNAISEVTGTKALWNTWLSHGQQARIDAFSADILVHF